MFGTPHVSTTHPHPQPSHPRGGGEGTGQVATGSVQAVFPSHPEVAERLFSAADGGRVAGSAASARFSCSNIKPSDIILTIVNTYYYYYHYCYYYYY